MSKFGSLSVATDKPFRMPISLPGEMEPLIDEHGNEAYIDFLPWDSEPGRKFEQEQNREIVKKGFRQRSRAEIARDVDSIDIEKDQAERLAALAVGWHLVDPATKEAIDHLAPFSRANALELFKEPGMGWLRRQAWIWVSNEQNFMQRSSKTSSPSPSTNSGSTDRAGLAAPSATT